MEIKPLLYVTSATIETNIVYPVSNFNELNKKNKFLKEVIYLEGTYLLRETWWNI